MLIQRGWKEDLKHVVTESLRVLQSGGSQMVDKKEKAHLLFPALVSK